MDGPSGFTDDVLKLKKLKWKVGFPHGIDPTLTNMNTIDRCVLSNGTELMAMTGYGG